MKRRRKRRKNATTENTKWQLKSRGNVIFRPSPSWDKGLERTGRRGMERLEREGRKESAKSCYHYLFHRLCILSVLYLLSRLSLFCSNFCPSSFSSFSPNTFSSYFFAFLFLGFHSSLFCSFLYLLLFFPLFVISSFSLLLKFLSYLMFFLLI